MDVKYIPADWDRARSSLKHLIGKGPYGKGIIDELKDISANFEKAEKHISSYDSDGVISFHHTDRKNTYQALFEDFEVLYNFTGKVGDIVDRIIDEPFYQDMDDFVAEIQKLSISNYTTENRIGATTTFESPDGSESIKVEKQTVGVADLFSGDSFYGKQMRLEYEAWKEMNVDAAEDISQADYQIAALNTRAFGYESIRDTQENKEFWVNIAAIVVIVGAALVFPPAGIALGTVYGAAELSSAVSGKDWVSGRELGTGERWFRGALAPLDIIPGAAAVKNFSHVSKINHFTEKLDVLGKTTALTNKARSDLQKTSELIRTASKEAAARLKHADAVMKDRIAKVPTKLAEGALATARVVDEKIMNTKNFASDFIPNLGEVPVGGVSKIPATNTHTFENIVQSMIKDMGGLNIRTHGTNPKIIKEQDFGKHIIKGKNGRKELAPNVSYITADGYKYTTDELGRIVDVEANELILQKGERNPGMQRVAGREDRLPDDDGGHLIGAQFRGSGDIDNLVAQNKQINRSGGEWYNMEKQWAEALGGNPPKKVYVQIRPHYPASSLRPDSFGVIYEIEGKGLFEKTIENKMGG